jgi:hypothetical protein
MIETENELRELLRASVAEVQAPERVRHFAPVGRRRLHPRHSALIVIPLLAMVGAGAAAAVTSLQSTNSGTSRIFLRETTDGVHIRGYTFSGVSGFTGELSTDRAVGLVFGDRAHLGPTKVRAEDVTIFGTNGHDATAVAVRAGSDVSTVTVRFRGGGSDTMHPVDGWAVLAHQSSHHAGSLTAYDSNGRVLASTLLPPPSNPGGPPEVSTPTFVRTTSQGVLIVGHIDNGFLAPDLADRAAVQVGLEGFGVCRPATPTGLAPGIVVVGVDEGEPMTVVIVHSGSQISKVRVVFANHVEDQMAPINGQSVLATVGTIAASGLLDTLQPGYVEGFGQSGKLVSKVTLYPVADGVC